MNWIKRYEGEILLRALEMQGLDLVCGAEGQGLGREPGVT